MKTKMDEVINKIWATIWIIFFKDFMPYSKKMATHFEKEDLKQLKFENRPDSFRLFKKSANKAQNRRYSF